MRRTSLLPLVCVLLFAACLREPAKPWWKGNLHTHSLWSDGDDYPEMIAEWYKTRGYNFLAISDHNILSDREKWISVKKSMGGEPAFAKYLARFGEKWVEQRESPKGKEARLKMLSEFRGLSEAPGRFLMIPAEEITSRYLSAPIHINATNIKEFIKPQEGRSVVEVMQKTVDAVVEQSRRTGVPMFPHINHPNFGWGITAEELMQLNNERFFEVYNGHPDVHNEGDANHARMERMWDIVLTERLAVSGKEVMFGLATDDSHYYHNEPGEQSRPGRGWVMVRAAKLTAEDLIAAMDAGDFYASSGVRVKDVQTKRGELIVEIDAEPGVTYTTEFIGTRSGYDPKSEPVVGPNGAPLRTTRVYSKDIGAVLATISGPSATYSLKGDEIYVRATITSSKLKTDPYMEGEVEKAWTQPVSFATKRH